MGETIHRMIVAGTTIPIRKSESFEFVGTGFVSVKIGARTHLLNLINDFGYAPKDIECTIEVGTSPENIRFDITDTTTGKSKSYPI